MFFQSSDSIIQCLLCIVFVLPRVLNVNLGSGLHTDKCYIYCTREHLEQFAEVHEGQPEAINWQCRSTGVQRHGSSWSTLVFWRSKSPVKFPQIGKMRQELFCTVCKNICYDIYIYMIYIYDIYIYI